MMLTDGGLCIVLSGYYRDYEKFHNRSSFPEPKENLLFSKWPRLMMQKLNLGQRNSFYRSKQIKIILLSMAGIQSILPGPSISLI